jgi:hypothetical protein
MEGSCKHSSETLVLIKPENFLSAEQGLSQESFGFIMLVIPTLCLGGWSCYLSKSLILTITHRHS